MPQDELDRRNQQDNLSPVRLPSGGAHFVHDREVGYFNDRRDRYEKDNHFSNISDLQDLDRLLIVETLVQRWGSWLSQQRDYWNEEINENDLQKWIKDHSSEIRMLKKALGVDKETRDKVRGEDSVDAFIRSLRVRAKEFGYMRNAQSAKAVELFQYLSGLVQLYENCDEQERRENHCTSDEIIKWFIETGRPAFEEIDAEFRREKQAMWIRKQ